MSSGVKGGGAASSVRVRVSIPSNVKKMIENIKEITGQNHTEDEIYTMLKECSMDPNDTTQKLLALDTFHEVKRKRDKKKENLNMEPTESKWKPPSQARINRAGSGNYPSRYTSHDAGGGRNLSAAKGNAPSPILEKGTSKAPLAATQETKKSSAAAVSNGPSAATSPSNNSVIQNLTSASGGVKQSNPTNKAGMSKPKGPLPLSIPTDLNTNPNALGTSDMQQYPKLDSSNIAKSNPSAPASRSYISSADPVLLPSQELSLQGVVGTIQRGVGIQRTSAEPTDKTTDKKPSSKNSVIAASEVGNSNLQPKMANSSQGVEKNRHLEQVHPESSTIGFTTASRPSSSQNNRTQVVGSQKVGPGKEWKPKSTNSNVSQGAASSEDSTVFIGEHPEKQQTPVGLTPREDTLELQRKLEESHISHRQHVIIPSHVHVPEVEKLGFCFGSFDASFGLDTIHSSVDVSDNSPPLSESSEAIDEPIKELQLSNQNAVVPLEDSEIKHPEQAQSPLQGPENSALTEVGVSSSVTPDYNESVQEVASEIHQHPMVHASSNYNFGFMPQVMNGHQLTPMESSESQARDAPRLPGFVVQQSFDPASFYAQFYRPGIDSDGRLSPFHSAGAANKYNGIAGLVPPQSSQSPQEGGVPMVLSTASPTPLVTQAAGVMQSSIPTQQPLPVFRHPNGVHLPYPPNYFPYGPYFPPFYPPAVHQFLSNGTFSQQPQAGNLYSTPSGATAKYSVSQYKQGSNTGNSTHVGMPGNFAPYGVANYNSTAATAAVTSTSGEDLAAPQVKENNIYVNGQQSESSGVWYTTPGRDISTMQASSFYNLPQGQMGFAPTPQPGHGAFPGIFHPAQAAAGVHPFLQQSQAITSPADMIGQTTSMYQQQSQHSQINWPSNY